MEYPVGGTQQRPGRGSACACTRDCQSSRCAQAVHCRVRAPQEVRTRMRRGGCLLPAEFSANAARRARRLSQARRPTHPGPVEGYYTNNRT